MEFIFEILFQFLAELLIQCLGELLVNFGARSLVDGNTARRHPIVCLFGNVVLGLIAGAISVLIFRRHFIASESLRVAALFVVAGLAGWGMSAFGKWQEKQGGVRAGLERFWNGFAFAFAMGSVRFFFAR